MKVEVRRNFYPFQSHATASVLNADREWTVTAAEPDSEWHPQGVPLGDVARKLRDRAAAILGPDPELTRPGRQAAPPRRPASARNRKPPGPAAPRRRGRPRRPGYRAVTRCRAGPPAGRRERCRDLTSWHGGAFIVTTAKRRRARRPPAGPGAGTGRSPDGRQHEEFTAAARLLAEEAGFSLTDGPGPDGVPSPSAPGSTTTPSPWPAPGPPPRHGPRGRTPAGYAAPPGGTPAGTPGGRQVTAWRAEHNSPGAATSSSSAAGTTPRGLPVTRGTGTAGPRGPARKGTGGAAPVGVLPRRRLHRRERGTER